MAEALGNKKNEKITKSKKKTTKKLVYIIFKNKTNNK